MIQTPPSKQVVVQTVRHYWDTIPYIAIAVTAVVLAPKVF